MEKYNANSDLFREKSVFELLSLQGQTIIVTGGGRGIGLAFTRGCAEAKADLAVIDILPSPDHELSLMERDLGVKVRYYQTDITDEAATKATFESIKQEFGRIDGLVNAAGIGIMRKLTEMSVELMQKIINVNLIGTMTTSRLAAEKMIAQGTGGTILNVSSVGGHRSVPGQQNTSVYNASKGGVLAFTKAIAVELAEHGIRANSISPGYVLTDMSPGYREGDLARLQNFESLVPLGRFADRAELKSLVPFLLSQASSYTSGVDIVVDGALLS